MILWVFIRHLDFTSFNFKLSQKRFWKSKDSLHSTAHLEMCSFISWIFWLVMLPLLLTLWLCVCYLIELFIRINRDSLVSHWREKSAKKNFPALLAHQHIYAHDDEFSLLLPKGKLIQVNKLFTFIKLWMQKLVQIFYISQEKIEIVL